IAFQIQRSEMKKTAARDCPHSRSAYSRDQALAVGRVDVRVVSVRVGIVAVEVRIVGVGVAVGVIVLVSVGVAVVGVVCGVGFGAPSAGRPAERVGVQDELIEIRAADRKLARCGVGIRSGEIVVSIVAAVGVVGVVVVGVELGKIAVVVRMGGVSGGVVAVGAVIVAVVRWADRASRQRLAAVGRVRGGCGRAGVAGDSRQGGLVQRALLVCKLCADLVVQLRLKGLCAHIGLLYSLEGRGILGNLRLGRLRVGARSRRIAQRRQLLGDRRQVRVV